MVNTQGIQEAGTGTRKVVFVCTANMYRSRIAEVLFNHGTPSAGIHWHAESAALSDVRHLHGMSSFAKKFLLGRGLLSEEDEPRDPRMLTAHQLETADLVIGICRADHERAFRVKFTTLAQKRIEQGRLQFWNIYDCTQSRPGALARIAGLLACRKTQPHESGTEHIDLAVQALLNRLQTT